MDGSAGDSERRVMDVSAGDSERRTMGISAGDLDISVGDSERRVMGICWRFSENDGRFEAWLESFGEGV